MDESLTKDSKEHPVPDSLDKTEHMPGAVKGQVFNPTKKSQYLLDMLTLPEHK